MRRFQPSTSTKSMILNGSAISTGETIIMPMDISTLATTNTFTAAASGFADQSHVTRQFKQAYGVSPGQWRTLTRH